MERFLYRYWTEASYFFFLSFKSFSRRTNCRSSLDNSRSIVSISLLMVRIYRFRSSICPVRAASPFNWLPTSFFVVFKSVSDSAICFCKVPRLLSNSFIILLDWAQSGRARQKQPMKIQRKCLITSPASLKVQSIQL